MSFCLYRVGIECSKWSTRAAALSLFIRGWGEGRGEVYVDDCTGERVDGVGGEWDESTDVSRCGFFGSIVRGAERVMLGPWLGEL